MKKTIRIIIGVVFILAFLIGCCRFKSFILYTEVSSMQKTLIEQRILANPVELTGMTDKIVKMNIELERLQNVAKLDRKSIFFSDKIKNLNRLK